MRIAPIKRRSQPVQVLGSLCLPALLLALSAGCAATKQAEPKLTPEEQTLNVESFDLAWETIQERHWDPELNGVDWAAVREELRPQVAQAETMSEARGVMHDMIGRLGQSHFGIIPQEAYEGIEGSDDEGDAEEESEAADESESDGDGEAGLSLRLVGGQVLVTEVWENSAADEAGVRPGWVLLKVGDTEIAEVLDRLADTELTEHEQGMMVARGLQQRFEDGVGETVHAVFLNGAGNEIPADLTLKAARGKRIALGYMPPFNVWYESKLIEGNLGYIAFNLFLDPMMIMSEFGESMKRFHDTDGIILDMRGNLGGLGDMAMGIGGWFVDESGLRLGTMKLREAELKFVLNPRAQSYEGPLAILVDGLSASTTEILAGGLQDLGRARLFGTRTAGAALPSQFVLLPNGDRLQYAFANYISAGGQVLEGEGVNPDEHVEHTREALLEGRDLILETAVRWLRSEQ